MAQGTKVSYGNTAIRDRSMVEDLMLITPKDVPFLQLISGAMVDDEGVPTSAAFDNLPTDCEATTYEWLEDEDLKNSFTTTLLQDDGATALGTAGVTLLVANTATMLSGYVTDYMNEDLILEITQAALVEQVRVTAVNATTRVLTITRNWDGGGAENFAGTSGTVTIVGRAHKEGTDAPTAVNYFPQAYYNYVQELTDTVSLSEIEQSIKTLGIDDAVSYESRKRQRMLIKLAARQVFWGVRKLATSSVPAAFGGLKTYIPGTSAAIGTSSLNTTDANGAALTAAMIGDTMQTIFGLVGLDKMPDTIVCNAWARRRLTALFATSSVTTFRDQEERRGGVKVDTVVTDFSDMDIVLDPNCPPQEIFLVKKDMCHFGPLKGKEFRIEALAKTGTSDKWMVTGAYTFALRGSNCHGLVRNFSLSS